MDFNSIMKIFLPKDRVFFQLFEEVAEHVYEMGVKLKEMVNEPDVDVRANILAQIENLEHKNDELTHNIFTELGRNFITPFDREDIHALATAIDDVADYVHGSANRMLLYNVKHVNEAVRKLAELINQGCKDIDKAIKELKDLKNIRNVTDSCVRINSMENQADYVFDMAVADLFKNETDAIELFKMKELLAAMETATDKCEDAANVMESIIVKHA